MSNQAKEKRDRQHLNLQKLRCSGKELEKLKKVHGLLSGDERYVLIA